MQHPIDRQTIDRWQQIAAFDTRTLEVIYRDTTATFAAMVTVPLVMLISGLGGVLWMLLEDSPRKGKFLLESVVLGSILGTGLFFVWAGLVAAAAGQLGRQDNAALSATVRTLSFATVPFAFSFFIFIPGLEFPITLTAAGLLLLSTTLATQIAVGSSIGRALSANALGFLLWVAVLSALSGNNSFAPPLFLWERFGP